MSNYGIIRARLFAGLPEVFGRWNHRRDSQTKQSPSVMRSPTAPSYEEAGEAFIIWRDDWVLQSDAIFSSRLPPHKEPEEEVSDWGFGNWADAPLAHSDDEPQEEPEPLEPPWLFWPYLPSL